MLWAIVKGGPVMIPIIAGSILGLGIVIEKLWMLFRMRMDVESFADDIFKKLKSGRVDAALVSCAEHESHPVAVVFKAGIEKRRLASGDIEKLLERIGNSQIKSAERYIGGLISIIGIEPLLGFLGTITGLIRAFMAWERAGSNITVGALASGIYEAMITTAAGLIIAVPYYLVCNFIISRIKYISYEVSDASTRLVEVLSEISPQAVSRP